MARKKIIRKERGANWEPKVIHQADRNRWMVDCGFKFDPAKRLRQFYPTEQEARDWAAIKRTEFLEVLAGRKVEERAGLFARLSSLSDTQRKHIIEAISITDGDTSRIIRALRFYEKHTSTADASRKLADVYEEYIKAKDQAGRRPRTIRDAKSKLTPFKKVFGEQSISEISTADVEGWLNDQDYIPSTRNAYRIAISGLFTHAVKRRYTEHNPAGAIEAVTVDQGLPTIHTVAQVKAMLRAAMKLDSHAKRVKLVPYLVIGYFAGLRPENELVNLDWKDIDFEARTIRVHPATAKKRRQRYVDMSDNLVQWLAPYVQKSGKIGFSRRLFREVRVEPKVDWSKDVMRHSFGSYLLAQNEDAPKTALQMGHSRVDVLFNHYRNLVKKSVAAEYWKITPSNITATT
jgi:integrase